jgi:hypothetical protein
MIVYQKKYDMFNVCQILFVARMPKRQLSAAAAIKDQIMCGLFGGGNKTLLVGCT